MWQAPLVVLRKTSNFCLLHGLEIAFIPIYTDSLSEQIISATEKETLNDKVWMHYILYADSFAYVGAPSRIHRKGVNKLLNFV